MEYTLYYRVKGQNADAFRLNHLGKWRKEYRPRVAGKGTITRERNWQRQNEPQNQPHKTRRITAKDACSACRPCGFFFNESRLRVLSSNDSALQSKQESHPSQQNFRHIFTVRFHYLTFAIRPLIPANPRRFSLAVLGFDLIIEEYLQPTYNEKQPTTL